MLVQRAGTVLVEPPLQLLSRDQDAPTAPDHPQLVADVLVEVVAAHPESRGCFVGGQSETRDGRGFFSGPRTNDLRPPATRKLQKVLQTRYWPGGVPPW